VSLQIKLISDKLVTKFYLFVNSNCSWESSKNRE